MSKYGNCIDCGKPIEKNYTKKVYCNRDCYTKHRNRNKAPYKSIQSGTSLERVIKKHEKYLEVECLGKWLKTQYLDNLKSYREIMRMLNTKSNRTIPKLLNHYNIPIRYGSDAVATQWINNDERRQWQSKWLTKVATGNTSQRIPMDEIRQRYKDKNMTVIKREVKEYNNKSSNSHRTHIQYKCDICGNIQWQMLANFTNGCPKCNTSSKGEIAISEWLDTNNLQFTEQYSIKKCRNKLPLPFDFALFHGSRLVALIEYQGEQHYRAIDFFGGEEQLKRQQKHDNIKRTYCKANNIPLIEVPYTVENIEEYLDKQLDQINTNIQLSIL